MTGYGVCEPWPVTWTCDISTQSPAATGSAVLAASEILDALTGRQFVSGCQVTLRPCRRDCWAEFPAGWGEWPGRSWTGGGLWVNLVCGACPGSCSCSAVSEVLLPALVNTVVEVKVDGSPLATGSYRIDDGRRLVHLDGEAWPRCQDFTLADTEDGTWSVTATYGQPLPELAALAVGEVACEVLRGCAGEDCRLPANVTQLVRQGVTVQMADPAALLDSGLLGLTWVDRLIRAVNPHGLPSRSRVYSVDRAAHRRVGTAAGIDNGGGIFPSGGGA